MRIGCRSHGSYRAETDVGRLDHSVVAPVMGLPQLPSTCKWHARGARRQLDGGSPIVLNVDLGVGSVRGCGSGALQAAGAAGARSGRAGPIRSGKRLLALADTLPREHRGPTNDRCRCSPARSGRLARDRAQLGPDARVRHASGGRNWLSVVRVFAKDGAARAVQIDIEASMLSLRYPAEINLHGDAAATLKALLPLIRRKDVREAISTPCSKPLAAAPAAGLVTLGKPLIAGSLFGRGNKPGSDRFGSAREVSSATDTPAAAFYFRRRSS
jgi:hypothetical protein